MTKKELARGQACIKVHHLNSQIIVRDCDDTMEFLRIDVVEGDWKKLFQFLRDLGQGNYHPRGFTND